MNTRRLFAIILAFCFFAAMLAGCAKTASDDLSGDEESLPPSSRPNTSGSDLTNTPESIDPEASQFLGWSEPEYGETKDITLMIEGLEETVTMTYMEIDFSWRNAPNIAMYIDRERYTCVAFEGEYDVFPYGDTEGEHPNRVHFYPYYGKTAQEYLDEIKSRTEDWGEVITDEGRVELDSHTALYFATENGACYFIDYDGGCVLLSFAYQPEAAEGHAIRLMESIKTVQIIE